MADRDPEPLGGKGKTVEIDETFIGQPDQTFVHGKGWQKKRGTATKRKILTMVERNGRAVSVKVEDLTVETLKTVIGKTVILDSDLNTDEAQHYKSIGREVCVARCGQSQRRRICAPGRRKANHDKHG